MVSENSKVWTRSTLCVCAFVFQKLALPNVVADVMQ